MSDQPYDENMIDLKLPDTGAGDYEEVEEAPAIVEEPFKQEAVQFEEKTADVGLVASSSGVKMEFKKRKGNAAAKRNVRQRVDDE